MIDHPAPIRWSGSSMLLPQIARLSLLGLLTFTVGPLDLCADDSDPAWKQGKPRWNGSTYETPTEAPPLLAQKQPGAPYSVPVDPQTGLAASPRFDLPIVDPQPADFVPRDIRLTNRTIEPLTLSIDDALVPPVDQLPEPTSDPLTDEDPLTDDPDASDQLELSLDPTIGEHPPLEEEVARWYQYPVRWMRGWDSHAEFGLDGSDGNARTLAIQTGLELKRKTDLYTLAIDVDYRQASNRGVTTEDNGRFNVDYDRLIHKSSWSGFGKFGMEWDRFKAFDLRVNVNGGLGYYWLRDDSSTLVTRLGAGASREIGAPVDDWIAEGVFGIEAEHQLTARQKLKGKVDYFPAWEDFSDFRVVTDVAWEILLDGSENLSLKLAATDRYDSTPQGAKANDVYYSLLLLYKF